MSSLEERDYESRLEEEAAITGPVAAMMTRRAMAQILRDTQPTTSTQVNSTTSESESITNECPPPPPKKKRKTKSNYISRSKGRGGRCTKPEWKGKTHRERQDQPIEEKKNQIKIQKTQKLGIPKTQNQTIP